VSPQPSRQPQSRKPMPVPTPEKRPSWWADPINRYTAVLWLLGILVVLICLLLLANLLS
jgi:hypothetical protein